MVSSWPQFYLYAPVVIAIGSLITAFMAYRSFRHLRYTSVRDTTVSLIMRMTSEQHVTDMIDRFRCLRNSFEERDLSNPTLDVVAQHTFVWSGQVFDGTRVIRDMFNFYEAVALGIDEGWLNESIFKSYWKAAYVQDWYDYSRYVDELREKYGVLEVWAHYQDLVERWKD